MILDPYQTQTCHLFHRHAHSDCSPPQIFTPYDIPLFFHSFSTYDAFLMLTAWFTYLLMLCLPWPDNQEIWSSVESILLPHQELDFWCCYCIWYYRSLICIFVHLWGVKYCRTYCIINRWRNIQWPFDAIQPSYHTWSLFQESYYQLLATRLVLLVHYLIIFAWMHIFHDSWLWAYPCSWWLLSH